MRPVKRRCFKRRFVGEQVERLRRGIYAVTRCPMKIQIHVDAVVAAELHCLVNVGQLALAQRQPLLR